MVELIFLIAGLILLCGAIGHWLPARQSDRGRIRDIGIHLAALFKSLSPRSAGRANAAVNEILRSNRNGYDLPWNARWRRFCSALDFLFRPDHSAAARHHKHCGAVFPTNLTFGWTFLGWAIAAIWPRRMNQQRAAYQRRSSSPPWPSWHRELADAQGITC